MTLYRLEDTEPQLPEGPVWIAPTASVIGNVKLEPHSSVWFGAVIRGDNELIHIGKRSNVQDNCALHTDPGFPLTIGPNCTIGHKVILHGCTIGEATMIGMGATVMNGAKIGDHCIIGANALVPEGKEFPPYSLVVGAPAKVIRTLSEEHEQVIAAAAETYVRNGERYRAEFSEV